MVTAFSSEVMVRSEKSAYGGKSAEIDDIFPICEVGDDVIAVVGAEDEGIGARCAGERVVAGSTIVRGFVRHGAGLPSIRDILTPTEALV